MEKVIFLDIDGVLNCNNTPNSKHFPYIADERLVRRFRSVLEASGASAVLSSTWRFYPAGLFSARYYHIPFEEVLPDLTGRPRSEEIGAWLSSHPQTQRYAVLDDEDDELDGLPLFQPNSREGLTDEIAVALVRYLNGESNRDMRASLMRRWVQICKQIVRGHPG